MADDQGAQGQQGSGDGGKGSQDGFKPITSQDDLNRVIGDRISREREKFADYDDLKAKAAKLDQIEAANQTEAEKTAKQIADLQKQLTETQTTALRARVQARHSISDEDAALFLTATDEVTLNKQAERLAERTADRKKQGNRAPLQGRSSNQPGKDEPLRQVTRQLFGSDD